MADHPESNAEWSAQLESFREWIVGPKATRASLMLLFAGGLLLLLACANVSSLLLAQATARRTEIALRAALGANRRRLARQLFTESALLALLAAGVGLLLTFWSLSAIRSLEILPRLEGVAVDREVLLFTLLVTVLTGLVFGSAPIAQCTRGDLRAALGSSGRSTSTGERRLRDLLVVGELVLAMTLLIGASLLMQSFFRLQEICPGFDPDGVVMLEISLPEDRYPAKSPRIGVFYREVLERLEGLPAVHAAGATMVPPFSR